MTRPAMFNVKPKVDVEFSLDDWAFMGRINTARGNWSEMYFRGDVFGHPQIIDGARISTIIGIKAWNPESNLVYIEDGTTTILVTLLNHIGESPRPSEVWDENMGWLPGFNSGECLYRITPSAIEVQVSSDPGVPANLCDECYGTGEYVGLFEKGTCKACNGAGIKQ